MKKTIAALFLAAQILLMSFIFVHQAFASEILFVSPTRVSLDDQTKVAVMNVTNVSNVERTYKVGMKDIVMTEKGVTKGVEDFPYSAKKMIRFFPRQFTVGAGQKQAVRIMAKIPADTPDGQYHVHVYFFEDAAKQGSEPAEEGAPGVGKAVMRAPLSYSVMMPITVTKGKIETSVAMSDPKITKSIKPGAKANTYTVDMQLARSGNGQGVVYADVIYMPDGGEAKQIGKRRTAYIYREIDKRDYNFDFEVPEGASPGGKIKLRLLSGNKSNPTLVNEALLAIP